MSATGQHDSGKQKGKLAEEHFLRVVNESGNDTPSWLLSVREGDEQEDSQGIDAVAVTDIGEIPIQVKSSSGGVFKHMRKYGNKHLIVLVDVALPTELLRSFFFSELRNRRRKMSLNQKE